jgi:SAM-dependent methyltransferase
VIEVAEPDDEAGNRLAGPGSTAGTVASKPKRHAICSFVDLRSRTAHGLLDCQLHSPAHDNAMRLAARAEGFVEWLALRTGWVPVPLIESHVAATLARSIMAGVELGIFDAVALETLSAEAVAARCNTNPQATALLLKALAASNYLRVKDGQYALTRKSRKWLVSGSRNSIRDKLLLQKIEWRWLAELEDFVRTGQPLDFHSTMSAGERELYHRSMRALAGVGGREVAWRIPVPKSATLMLDLGGSHGHFAAEICRRIPGLRAEILDLPEAIETAAPILAEEGLEDRLVHVAGDVRQADLGAERYDLVLMSNLAHHLDEQTNRDVVLRIARSLKPNGVFVIQEPVVPDDPAEAGQLGTLLGLYFALQSRPGVRTWRIADMQSWQHDAGLQLRKPVRLRTAPGWVQQAARRSGRA